MNTLNANIDQILLIVFLSFRVGAFFLSLPFFSEIRVPLVLNVLLPVAMAGLLMPSLPLVVPSGVADSSLLFLLSIVGEVLVGTIMGFSVRILFVLANVSGELMGLQIGFSMASLFDPSLGQIPELSLFKSLFLILAFFYFNVHHGLILALTQSYYALPVGGSFLSLPEIVRALFQLLSSMYMLAFRFALPVLAVILMAHIVMGVISITAPEMNIYFNAAINANVMVGMLILALSFGLLFQFFQTATFLLRDFLAGMVPVGP